ncbi:uncharacterized protein LOC142339192 isoform X2 [Convolutriloba macropyga]|uniref:uncharacterized protein LOC142339192 isoform X2 n=1 Tax=Convolutriloba macropyga TaxID=536237 RepID=UPI003F52344A
MSSGGESGGGVVESARQKFRNRSAGLLTRKTSRERVRAATAATAPPTSSSTAPDATLSDGASGSVPEITTSSAPDDDDARQPTSSTASPTSSELLKDEKYVERLARNLSRKLEKTRNKLQKRTSELSLIKASPDSRNPSVILSCASDDEDESHEKKTPVRDTLSAEQPAGQGRLFRGLRRKLSKTSKRDSSLKKEAVGKLQDDSKKEANQDSGNVTIPGSGEDEDAISAASSSPSPPGSDYGGMVSHRGSWSTLLHAIGTAEMVQKVQRNAAEMKQERDIESLKRELEVHVSGNYQIKFGPVLPIWQAVLVFVLNALF